MSNKRDTHQRLNITIPAALHRRILAQRDEKRRINVSRVCAEALEREFREQDRLLTILPEY